VLDRLVARELGRRVEHRHVEREEIADRIEVFATVEAAQDGFSAGAGAAFSFRIGAASIGIASFSFLICSAKGNFFLAFTTGAAAAFSSSCFLKTTFCSCVIKS
jgi:hypothetical protein